MKDIFMLLKTLFKENDYGAYKAEIHKMNETDFRIDYYAPTGVIKSTTHQNTSIFVVENTASDWINSIKVLNG